jgi:hypothetical protein
MMHWHKEVEYVSCKNMGKGITLTNLFLARSAMDFRAVFPERVRGNPVIAAATWKAAMGPINSRTIFMSSLTILGSVFLAPDRTDIIIK